jgi:hypothetical protein
MTLHRRCRVIAWHEWRRLGTTAALVIGTTCGSLALAIPASAGPVQGQGGGVCIGRHPSPSAIWYTGAWDRAARSGRGDMRTKYPV